MLNVGCVHGSGSPRQGFPQMVIVVRNELRIG
jgi:hypothetical protein